MFSVRGSVYTILCERHFVFMLRGLTVFSIAAAAATEKNFVAAQAVRCGTCFGAALVLRGRLYRCTAAMGPLLAVTLEAASSCPLEEMVQRSYTL